MRLRRGWGWPTARGRALPPAWRAAAVAGGLGVGFRLTAPPQQLPPVPGSTHLPALCPPTTTTTTTHQHSTHTCCAAK